MVNDVFVPCMRDQLTVGRASVSLEKAEKFVTEAVIFPVVEEVREGDEGGKDGVHGAGVDTEQLLLQVFDVILVKDILVKFFIELLDLVLGLRVQLAEHLHETVQETGVPEVLQAVRLTPGLAFVLATNYLKFHRK